MGITGYIFTGYPNGARIVPGITILINYQLINIFNYKLNELLRLVI